MQNVKFGIEIEELRSSKDDLPTQDALLELSSLELALIGGGSGDVHFATTP